jgi:tetratricopeptide (TPR) repeat protein
VRIGSIIVAVALWLGIFSAPLLAAETNAAFDAANKLYAQAKFADAAAAYEQLLQSGMVSPALYFNLGNARFKAGEIGKAILAYRQAESLAPRDPDLEANLQFVRNQIQGPSATSSRWERALQHLTLNEWTLLAVTPLWICLLSLTALQFRNNSRSTFRNLAWLSGLAAIALGVCLVCVWKINSAPIAVVIANDAVVRNGPLEESPSSFTVHDGAELNVLDEKTTGFRSAWGIGSAG